MPLFSFAVIGTTLDFHFARGSCIFFLSGDGNYNSYKLFFRYTVCPK